MQDSMPRLQKFIISFFPKSWADSIRTESERWKIRCLTCGHTRSVWEAGGIRWKATSIGKRVTHLCPACGTFRVMAIELDPPV
jgi:Zn finger protein HypA/HybF involved in hydrogenase expression